MARRVITALIFLSAVSLMTPSAGYAQTFKVEKVDIKGEGGTDYITVEAATGRVFVGWGADGAELLKESPKIEEPRETVREYH